MNLLKEYGVSERFMAEATLYPGLQLARVVAQHRGFYQVVTDEAVRLATLSGKFRHEVAAQVQYPTVGDCVMVAPEEDRAVIHHLLTRKSLFARKAVGDDGQVQAVAANVDVVFLCMSLNQNFSLNRMERYLSIAWDSGAMPVVVLTKADLCERLDEMVAQIENIAGFADVLAVSVFDENICARLQPYFEKNQTCALIGSSGVGKSTLINQLLGASVLATKSVGKGDKGQHTTTARALFPCPLGGAVIDTPGMREMGAESADLSQSFADIEALAAQCKFRDCTHTNEPGCAVLAAVAEGALEKRRLDNYRKLVNETSYEGLNSREIETKKCERMFREVGGMKNARRFVSEKRKRR